MKPETDTTSQKVCNPFGATGLLQEAWLNFKLTWISSWVYEKLCQAQWFVPATI